MMRISAYQNNEWKFGTQTTFPMTYAAHFPVKAGPHQTMHGCSEGNARGSVNYATRLKECGNQSGYGAAFLRGYCTMILV